MIYTCINYKTKDKINLFSISKQVYLITDHLIYYSKINLNPSTCIFAEMINALNKIKCAWYSGNGNRTINKTNLN